MSAAELLAEVERLGVRLEAQGGQLRYRAPKGTLTPEILTSLAQHKAEIIAALTGGKTNGVGQCPGPERCGGCYEVSPGVHLHPPKVSEEWKAWLTKWQPKEGNPIQ